MATNGDMRRWMGGNAVAEMLPNVADVAELGGVVHKKKDGASPTARPVHTMMPRASYPSAVGSV